MLKKSFRKLSYLINSTFLNTDNSTTIEIFSDDVFLVSYPKSGNTWMRFLVGNYLTDCKIDFLNSHLVIPGIKFNPDQCAEVNFRPRFIKSHSSYTEAYPKVIYIVRDGRDVAVSYYYYLQKIGKIASDIPFSSFVGRFTKDGIGGLGNWSEHVETWLKKTNGSNLLLIKYEDMLSDTARELKKVIQFAGLEVDENRVVNAVRASLFEEMQKLEVKQHDDYFARYGAKNEDIRFVREGKVGNWRSYFSEEDEQKFLILHGDTLRKMNYV